MDGQVQGRSIIEVLSANDDSISHQGDQRDDPPRKKIIKKTLRLIEEVNASRETSSNGLDQKESIISQKDHKVVDALLDLLVLEGIYPSLSSGVGVPVERRLKSTLKSGFSTRPLDKATGGIVEDQLLLTEIVDVIHVISLSRKGLASSIHQRMSVDVIAAVGELAFSPVFEGKARKRFAQLFKNIMERSVCLNNVSLLPASTWLPFPRLC